MSQTAYNPALDQSQEDTAPRRSGVGSFGQVVFQVSEEQLALPIYGQVLILSPSLSPGHARQARRQ